MQSKINCPECNEPYTVIPNCGIICFNCWEFTSLEDIKKEIEKHKLLNKGNAE